MKEIRREIRLTLEDGEHTRLLRVLMAALYASECGGSPDAGLRETYYKVLNAWPVGVPK